MNILKIGVDISKATFDVALRNSSSSVKQKVFENTPQGFRDFLAWVAKYHSGQVHVVMEATGRYSWALATYLVEEKHLVSIVNPAAIFYFGQACLKRAKTDKLDAYLILDFAQKQELASWQPNSPARQNFKELVHSQEFLKRECLRIQNHLQEITLPAAREAIMNSITEIQKNCVLLVETINMLVETNPELHQPITLLKTIPGIGVPTAWKLLAQMPQLEKFFTAKQLAAHVGLNPSVHKSGTSVRGKGHISKIGDSVLRKALYMPALSLMRQDASVLGAFIKNLRVKGKNGKVIICAVMHKLIRIVFAVLKRGVAFDEALLRGQDVTNTC